jgi:hypothetical protein
MKLKNYSAWLAIVWAILAVAQSIGSVVNFVSGNLWVGVLFLILSVAFAFVCGILLQKAIYVYYHNKEVEWLESVHKAILESEVEKVKPFEEFNNGH